MRPLIPAILAVLAVASCSAANSPSVAPAGTSAAITPPDLERRLTIVAHDSMQGRETGSAGDFKTAEYIASEFKRLGLQPAGENGTYFQTVPFWLTRADPRSRITAGATTLTLGRDFVPSNPAYPARMLSGLHAIYAGAMNDSSRWISPAQARGNIVVLDLPPGMTARGLPLTPSRWQGAAAIAVVSLDLTAPEGIARVVEGRPVPQATLNPNVLPLMSLSRRATTAM